MKRPKQIYRTDFLNWDRARHKAGKFAHKHLELPIYGRGFPFGHNLLEIDKPEYCAFNIFRRAIAWAVEEDEDVTQYCADLFGIEIPTPAERVAELAKNLSEEEKKKLMDL